MASKMFSRLSCWLFSIVAYTTVAQTKDSLQPPIQSDIQLKQPSIILSQYTYDSASNRYIYHVKAGEIDIKAPLILTPEEYRRLTLQEHIKVYVKEKVSAIEDQNQAGEEALNNLLPQLYVKSNFFKTLFGSSTIDIVPQGSVAIDLGARYQKNDNPALSPRNRRNFSFDFDQRISVGINGMVGERLKVMANYDTESTFDFQNLIKLEFNPPNINEGLGLLGADKLQSGLQTAQDKIDQAGNKLQSAEQLLDQGYGGNEDSIIQKIEVGNVSMPLNSSLISGAQSLFGFKTQLQFGKTTITGVISEQRSQTQNVTAQGDGTLEEFSFFALDYDEDRHFFMAQFFRDQYDKALKTYPYINSGVQITRLEVWVTNRGNYTNNVRNIVALQDLGEASPENTTLDATVSNFFNTSNPLAYPDNTVNKLDPKAIGSGSILTSAIRDIATTNQGFGAYAPATKEGYDYAVLESARKLQPNEFTYHPQLGYISLNQRLSNDEVLGVAFQFTLNGQTYQVGEFAGDGVNATTVGNSNGQNQIFNNSLVVKLLKSSVTDVNQPTWDLMMKNIYNTGAYQLSQEDFKLNLFYTDPSPINYITPADEATWPTGLDSKILLQVLGLDKLNIYNDPQNGGDGFFDYLPGLTVDPQYGRIIFTSVEPFGENLFEILRNNNGGQSEDYQAPLSYNENQKKYVFREMYAYTKADAFDDIEKNKFQLKGRYKSTSGGEGISLGAFNVPRGSVRVTAGGRVLAEGVDYTVNYQLGRVQILDEGLKNSNIPIEVSTESNTFFGQQNKRFMGFDVEHKFNDKFIMGATVMNLNERPLTQKANYGVEPVNNTMFGLNGNFSKEIPFLTRMVNKLPNIDTDAPSNISIRGEVAYLLSSSPRNADFEGAATTYLDDFEGSQTTIDVKSAYVWSLSSVPFEGVEGSNAPSDDLASGYHRAKLSWYNIDPIFYTSQRPPGISDDDISTNETRRIFINEIFPQQDLVQGQTTVQNTLDLAYYPSEKGPYNNNTPTAFQADPKKNWAGITRSMTSTNFEQANVEFIEFWLLDTFTDVADPDDELGILSFHLGNISEDVLKDGRKQYENGLPGQDGTALTNSTSWGKTPASQSLVYAFDAIDGNRALQDVGLDGLSDAEEAQIFTNGPSNDPAGDNYQFFVSASGSVLERYKNYNGTDGNSPINVGDTDRGSTTQPDAEDVNRDNTMNTIDSYFEYKIPIRKTMDVGNHPFVTDVREDVQVSLPNGQSLKTRWIQFKIPVSPDFYNSASFQPYFNAVNGIGDLRSVRFMRMLLTDFEAPTVLRFGTLDLVRGDWRRYTKPLNKNKVVYANTTMDVSTVNILENENRIPINYVLPPGVVREQLNNSNTIVRQNEQSLSLRIRDLNPSDARGVFKNVDMDMRQYKKIKMFIHAESIQGQVPLPGEGTQDDYDKRLVAFLRLGTDFTNNYYQIEVPLKPSAFNNGGSNRLSSDAVWNPDENSIEVSLELLTKMKAASLSKGSLNEPVYFNESLEVIQEFDPISGLPGQKKYKFAVKGNPSLGTIRTIMVGVKNPSEKLGDMLHGEVWFNELRLSEIDTKGGWAAIGALDTNIADFATISATGAITTIGFGGIDQTPNQRSREDIREYGIATNFNVGQLLPKKWGIQLPVNYNISEEFVTPEYDPFYEDIRLEDRLETAERASQKDSIRNQAVSYTKRKSINLIGVRKNKMGDAKKRPYDIENFDFSYSYNEEKQQDYEIENLLRQSVRVGAGYQYSFKPVNIEPFKKIDFGKTQKYLKWLQEINLNPVPSNVQFSTLINRNFNSQRFREVYLEGEDGAAQLALPELQQRNFLFDWTLSLNHNLTRSLILTFNASNNNIVKNYFQEDSQGNQVLNKDLGIWDGFWDVGQPNQHSQSLGLTYTLPTKFLPYLDFVDASYNYTGDFNWQRGSNVLADVVDNAGNRLGVVNTIQNANTHTLNASLNMEKFYRSMKLVKRTKNKKSAKTKVINTVIGLATSLQRLRVNYSENNGKVLPGYTQSIGFLGTLKPSWGFVFGSQADVRFEAAKNGWLTEFPEFNQQFTQVHNTRLDINATLDLLRDLKFDLTANREYSENFAENFKVENGTYNPLTPNAYGNFGISTVLLKTAFQRSDETQSKTFQALKNNRLLIAQRLATKAGIPINDVDADGFPKGYGKTNQAVLLPAFLAAYTGADASKIALGVLRSTPLPNWNVQYTGFMRLKSFRKRFNRFSIGHAYRASYTLNSFRTNLEFDPQTPNAVDQSGNFLNEILYTNVNLVEQFNPLVKFDMEFKNSIRILAEMKKDRALSLSMDNNLLTETTGNEFIMGLGYRIRNVKLRTRVAGRRTTLSGDINIKADLSMRDNLTLIRNLDLLNNQVTAGQTLWSLKLTADYALSRNLTALFYYDHAFSKFAISTAFPQTTIRSGFTLRYNFGN